MQRLQATLDLLQLPPEAGKGLVLRVPGVLLQPPGVTRSHVLGLSALLNIPLVGFCCAHTHAAPARRLVHTRMQATRSPCSKLLLSCAVLLL